MGASRLHPPQHRRLDASKDRLDQINGVIRLKFLQGQAIGSHRGHFVTQRRVSVKELFELGLLGGAELAVDRSEQKRFLLR
ncbi:MAG: hypothetical protein D6695_02240 [Planctomycetota bacterium]|nr:MAG: hypothetical protein D6695_02240 [Planctomycetota bacterium]